MLKLFSTSMICIIAITCLTVSIANAQTFTDGDIIHMEDGGTLTDANLVEISQTSSSTTLDLFFRVTIAADRSDDTLINVSVLGEATATLHYQNNNQWDALNDSSYSKLREIATAQGTTTVNIRIRLTTVPTSRFQVQLGEKNQIRIHSIGYTLIVGLVMLQEQFMTSRTMEKLML